MIDKSLWAEVTEDDFADSELRDVARLIGVQQTLELLASFGGAHIYIPTIPKGFARRWIRTNAFRHSSIDLTRLLGLSQSTVYRLLHEETLCNPQQTDLFNEDAASEAS